MGKKHQAIAGEIVSAHGPWQEMLLVCRKCSRKLDGGFGPEEADDLVSAFKQLLRDTGRRRAVRILEVGCLGICPKKAVTVVRASAPDEMLVIPKGLDLSLLAGRLGGTSAAAAASPPSTATDHPAPGSAV